MTVSTYATRRALDSTIQMILDKQDQYHKLLKSAHDAIQSLQNMCDHKFVEHHIGGHNNEDIDICTKCGMER